MNLKKLAFSEQFPWPRRRVLSGFGLGVGLSIVVFALLLLSHFLKGPPIIQGFQSISANSSFLSFPFSKLSSSNSSSAISELQNSEDLLNKTHSGNSSEIHLNENLVEEGGKGPVLEKTHFSNFTEHVKNGSFNGYGGKLQQQTHEANGPVVAEKGTPSDYNGEGLAVDEKAHPGNASEIVENGSMLGEEERVVENAIYSGKEDVVIEKAIAGISLKNNGNEESKGRENNNLGNVSRNGKLGYFSGEEEKSSEASRRGNSTEENKITIVTVASRPKEMQNVSYEECNIFDGKWVRDDSKPYYPGGSCPYIDKDFDCHLNRRPDDGFVKWKWQPNGCDIPSLNATDFLERLRGKKLVFVGDSLNRNMWESLVCILRHSIRNKKRVYEISGQSEFKKKGFYAFRFEDYNCSVDFVGSPFLVRESSHTNKNGTFETLRIDLMDRTTSMYHDADIIVFNTGHWWTHEKTSRGEDYYQEGNYVHPRLKVLEAYKRALTTWAKWVDKNVDTRRTQVFFRGYSVTHFRGGQWNSGGQCHKETEPIFNTTYLAKYPSKMRALEHVLREMRTPVIYLNISRLTDYRKDAHPSIYRTKYEAVEEQIAAVRSQDCSHWCLPGVPDTWNELLYASLLKAKRGSWRK